MDFYILMDFESLSVVEVGNQLSSAWFKKQ